MSFFQWIDMKVWIRLNKEQYEMFRCSDLKYLGIVNLKDYYPLPKNSCEIAINGIVESLFLTI
jgi:hypothetical protein